MTEASISFPRRVIIYKINNFVITFNTLTAFHNFSKLYCKSFILNFPIQELGTQNNRLSSINITFITVLVKSLIKKFFSKMQLSIY